MFKRMNLRPLLPSIAVVGFILGSASSGSAQDGLFSVGNLDTLSQLIVVGTIKRRRRWPVILDGRQGDQGAGFTGT